MKATNLIDYKDEAGNFVDLQRGGAQPPAVGTVFKGLPFGQTYRVKRVVPGNPYPGRRTFIAVCEPVG